MPAWRGVPLAAVGGLTALAASTTAAMNTAIAAANPPGVAAAATAFATAMSSLPCDMHNCGLTTPNPHVGGVVITGSPTVSINGMPACRAGDQILEAGPPNVIVMGCPTVFIGDTGMGGIGTPDGACMSAAKEAASAFIETVSEAVGF